MNIKTPSKTKLCIQSTTATRFLLTVFRRILETVGHCLIRSLATDQTLSEYQKALQTEVSTLVGRLSFGVLLKKGKVGA